MNAIVASPMRDLVAWLERRPRTYTEAWRTSCPRLMVWEDAVDGGLIAIITETDGVMLVRPTAYGMHRVERRLITPVNGGDAPAGMAVDVALP